MLLTSNYIESLPNEPQYIVGVKTLFDRVFPENFSEKYIVLALIALGYDFASINIQDMYPFLLSQLPELNWFEQQLQYIRNLPEESQEYITFYTGYGFSQINNRLRLGRRNDSTDRLQQEIMNSPPSNKDYIVFRILRKADFITGDKFFSRGFLSTTVDYPKIIRGCCEALRQGFHYTILRIVVPTHVRGLYVEGKSEMEILFPTDITINVLNRGLRQYYNPFTKDFVQLPTIDMSL